MAQRIYTEGFLFNFLAVAMALYHLIYQSRALASFTDAELAALLLRWRDHNRQVHVTGLLLYSSDGRFLQLLEGEDADVRQLYYQLILSDPRHHQCRVLSEGSCTERSFADWSMGMRIAQEKELHELLENDSLPHPTRLGPKSTIRPELLKMLLEFVAAGNS